jgi:site-specific DNA recombinase
LLTNPVYAIADREVFNYLIEKGYDVCSGIEEFNGINGLNGYNKTRQDKENSSAKTRDSSEWIISVGMHKGIIPGGYG